MERAYGVPPENKKAKPTLAEQVAKLQADFDYQYGYNQELIEKVAALTSERDDAVKESRFWAEERNSLSEYCSRLEKLHRPVRFWRSLAVTGWLIAAFAVSAIFYNFAVEPLANLQDRVKTVLSDEQSNEQVNEQSE